MVRDVSFGVPQSAACNPKKYVQVNGTLCDSMIHSANLPQETAFCAQGKDGLRNEGDPFVVKVVEENGSAPIYQVGLDTILSKKNSGVFINLYPFVQWINETIIGKAYQQRRT